MLLGKDNLLIYPTSSDFPPEVMTPDIKDPEQVVFELSEEAAASAEYQAWAEDADGSGTTIFTKKTVTFAAGSGQATVTWPPQEIQAYDHIKSIRGLKWYFQYGDTVLPGVGVNKKYFNIMKKPLAPAYHPADATRVEVMELACALAQGENNQFDDHPIRVRLERGLYETYSQEKRTYFSGTGSQGSSFNAVTCAFDLTGFLQKYTLDCQECP